nr:hypothetical protein GCM10020092_004030 [Actinoplanes digitatis]
MTRLYPAYWIALTLSVIVIAIWPSVRSISSWTDVAINYTMLQQGMGVPHVDGVYWTLFAELKFYLAFTIVVAMGVTFRRCVMFCVFLDPRVACRPRAGQRRAVVVGHALLRPVLHRRHRPLPDLPVRHVDDSG